MNETAGRKLRVQRYGVKGFIRPLRGCVRLITVVLVSFPRWVYHYSVTGGQSVFSGTSLGGLRS